jgi:hypothetical protein
MEAGWDGQSCLGRRWSGTRVKSIPAVRTTPCAEPCSSLKHFAPQSRECIMLQVVRSYSLGISTSRSSLQQENYVGLGHAVDRSVYSVKDCDNCAPLLPHYYQPILITYLSYAIWALRFFERKKKPLLATLVVLVRSSDSLILVRSRR